MDVKKRGLLDSLATGKLIIVSRECINMAMSRELYLKRNCAGNRENHKAKWQLFLE